MKSAGRWQLRAAHYRTGRTTEFGFRGERLVSRTARREKAELIYGPGFFDVQCNGFAGIDFNAPGLTPERLYQSIRALWSHGCTEVLPTIITHTPERLEELIRALANGSSDPRVAYSIPGFHLEGPFISPEDGARGAHPRHGVSPINPRLWQRLQRAAEGWIALVTLAPELAGAPPFIRRLRQEGVLPALGHTTANAAQIQAAADLGALLSTHLGNGCAQMLPRHANPIFAQLGCDALRASVIPDGIHLPPEVLRTIVRAKGLARTILTTDSMSAAGAAPGRYTLGDLVLAVGRDGVVRLPGSANFAGSALTMNRAVPLFARMAGVSLADAWDAASLRPRRLFAEARGPMPPHRSLLIVRAGADSLEVLAALRGPRLLHRSPEFSWPAG